MSAHPRESGAAGLEAMFATLAKYVGGKVLTVLVLFGCVCAGYWFYTHPEHLQAVGRVVGYSLAWIGLVVVLPWAGFLLTTRVVAMDSNVASALLLLGYAVADIVAALMLAGVRGHNWLAWIVLLIGFLSAGVYNFLVCEYQASRLEEG